MSADTRGLGKILYFLAGILTALGAVSELMHKNLAGAFGMALVTIILFMAIFEKSKEKA